MHLHKKTVAVVLLATVVVHLYAFNSGFTLGLKANLTGSLTDPRISKKDMDYLGGQPAITIALINSTSARSSEVNVRFIVKLLYNNW